MRISTKLLYLALLFALGFLGILARLYLIQISDDSPWKRGDEVTSARLNVFYPNRARILDRHGVVLADNESVWDVHINFYELTDPRNYLKHIQASSRFALDDRESSVAWYEAHVVPVTAAKYPDAQRARRFLDLWKLRNSPQLIHDRHIMMGVLADVFDVQIDDLRRRWQLIESEVSALIEPVLSGNPSRGELNRAYWKALEAMNDLEYWEEIRRFPKSLELEVELDERLLQSRRISDLLTTLRNEVQASPNFVTELMLRSSAAISGEVASLRQQQPVTVESGDSFELTRAPFSAQPDSQRQSEIRLDEQLRAWEALQEVIFEATTRSHQATNVLTFLDQVLVELEGRDKRGEPAVLKQLKESLEPWRYNALEDRLQRLRRRLFTEADSGQRSIRREYLERWVSYLSYTEEEDEALVDNPLLLTKDARRSDVESAKAYADVLVGIRFTARSERYATHPALMPALLGGTSLPGPDVIDAEVQRLVSHPNLAELADSWFGGNLEVMGRTFKGHVSQQPIGGTGIEGFYEDHLAGAPGVRLTYNDARGRVRSKQGEWNPQPSEDLHLTIDAGLQQFAADAVARWEPILRQQALESERKKNDLASGRKVIRTPFAVIGEEHWSLRGAVVVVDIQTGDVLCMLSFPDYDAELMAANTPEGKAYRDQVLRVESDDAIPVWARKARFLNRASGAAYAPGSTFKILTSIALLESGNITPSQTYNEDSSLYRGRGFTISSSHPVGLVDLRRAISQSSNGYFWHMTENIAGNSAFDRYTTVLKPWAQRFGFGSSPDLDVRGFVADGNFAPERGYPAKELANNAIGQGQLESSPLQLACFFAAVANRGTLLEPRLSTAKPFRGETIAVKATTWEPIHQGLRDTVVNGTAKSQGVLKRIRAAGKTGTAQVGFLSLKDRGEDLKDRDVVKPDHAWFAGYAPYDDPKIAFVVLAEYSGLSGAATGNLIGEIAEECLARNYGIDTRPSQNHSANQLRR